MEDDEIVFEPWPERFNVVKVGKQTFHPDTTSPDDLYHASIYHFAFNGDALDSENSLGYKHILQFLNMGALTENDLALTQLKHLPRFDESGVYKQPTLARLSRALKTAQYHVQGDEYRRVNFSDTDLIVSPQLMMGYMGAKSNITGVSLDELISLKSMLLQK